MSVFRSGLSALLLLALAAGLGCGDEAQAPPDSALETGPPEISEDSRHFRGLWVLCEGSQRVLEHPDRLEALLEDARRFGATDLFVQVYRGGRAWFDSSRADREPFEKMRTALGIDPLAELLPRAHEAGLRVHAWVNVLSLASHRNAKIVKELGREAVLVDRQGRSILDYPKLDIPQPDRRYYRMGTPAVWLDPAAPGVAEYLAATFAELMSRYPTLDGLHLDYIRYPGVLPFSPGSRFGVGLDFGYGDSTRARFKRETGLQAPLGESLRNANQWDTWRREKITELVRMVGAAAKQATDSAAPQATVSAAEQTPVSATSPADSEAAAAAPASVVISAAVGAYAERVYLAEGQDWRRWLEDGLLEFAVPMAYTLDDRMFRYMVEGFASGPLADRIWVGQGTWLFAKRPSGALDQLRVARQAGARAEVLFSYDSIADAPELRDALIAEFGELLHPEPGQ